MTSYVDRICPVCGVTFTPTKNRQIYHAAECRVKAYRRRHKADVKPLDTTGLLDEIRRYDPQAALDIEDIAKRAGLQIAEQILLVGWRLMNNAAIRKAEDVLIASGQVKPKKSRSAKKRGG